MAKEIVLNFKINETGESVEQVIKSAKEMREVMKELQTQMDEAEFGSEEYDALAASINNLNSQYEDLTKTTKEVDDSFAGLQKQIKAAKGELDKFKPGTKEYKEASKSLRELQDRMGDVGDAAKISGNGFERLHGSFGLLKEGIGTADFGKAKIAFSGLGAAMKALPIFLIIEGIKFLIEGFDKFKNSTGFLGTALRAIGDVISWIGDKISEFTDYIGLTNNALEKQNEKMIANATEQRAAIESRYDREIELAKAAGKDTAELEKAKAREVLKTLKIELDAIMALRKARGEYTEEEIKRIKEIAEEAKNIQNKVRASEITEDKKHADKKKENSKEYAKNQLEIIKSLQALQVDSIKDTREKETAALEKKFSDLNKEFESKKASKKQLEELESRHQSALLDLKIKYADEDENRQEEFNKLLVELFNQQQKIVESQGAVRQKQNDRNRDAFIKSIEDEIAILEMSGGKQKEIIQKKIELLSFQKEREKDLLDRGLEEEKKASDNRLLLLEGEYQKVTNLLADKKDDLAGEKDNVKKAAIANEIEILNARLNVSSQQIDAEKTNQGIILEEQANVNKKKLDIDRKYYLEAQKLAKENTDKIVAIINEVMGYITTFANQALGIWSSINDLNKAKSEEQIAQLEKNLDDRLAAMDKKRDEELEKLERQYEERARIEKSANDASLKQFDRYAKEKIEAAQALGINTTQLEYDLQDQKEMLQKDAAMREANLKIEEENRKIEIDNAFKQANYDAESKFYTEKEKLNEKAFKSDQNLKVAQTIMSTITGAVAVFTSFLQSSIPAPYNLIAGGIAAAAVAASGAIQVAAIKAQKYQAGTPPPKPNLQSFKPNLGGGASQSNGATALTPKDSTLFDTGGKSIVSGKDKPQQVVINNNEPLRAYVLEGDITSAQEANERLKRKSVGF